MTREEAINEIRSWAIPSKKGLEVLETLIPELAESEDERMVVKIARTLSFAAAHNLITDYDELLAMQNWLEKQKELFESGRGLYYYDGEETIYCGDPATAENPFNFAISQHKRQKECLADNSKTSASEDEKIRKFLVDFFASYKIGDAETKLNGVRIDDILAYLEKQKEQKPRWEITSPHTTKWTREMINEKFDELCGLERPGEGEADNETEVRKACDHNTGEKIPENHGWIITPNKKFFKWIYKRLIHVHKENPNVDYMRSLKERIDNMPSDEPQWKPTDSHLRFLRAVVNDPRNAGAESCQIALKSLLEELEKL